MTAKPPSRRPKVDRPPPAPAAPDAPAPAPSADSRPIPKPGTTVSESLARGEKLDASRLEMRFTGSADSGHGLRTLPGVVEKVFRVDEPMQALGYLSHCLRVLSRAETDDADEFNDQRGFMVSVVNDLGARDAVERMLAVQMAATHVAMIRAGGMMARADLLSQLEAHSTNFNKLARTFAAQMEALRKHRDGGKQKVTVEHVHVHPGGQAIVGEVHHGGQGPRGRGHR